MQERSRSASGILEDRVGGGEGVYESFDTPPGPTVSLNYPAVFMLTSSHCSKFLKNKQSQETLELEFRNLLQSIICIGKVSLIYLNSKYENG